MKCLQLSKGLIVKVRFDYYMILDLKKFKSMFGSRTLIKQLIMVLTQVYFTL